MGEGCGHSLALCITLALALVYYEAVLLNVLNLVCLRLGKKAKLSLGKDICLGDSICCSKTC